MNIQHYNGVHSEDYRNLIASLSEEELDFLTKVAKVNRTSIELEIHRLMVYSVDSVELSFDEIIEINTVPIFAEDFYGLPIILN